MDMLIKTLCVCFLITAIATSVTCQNLTDCSPSIKSLKDLQCENKQKIKVIRIQTANLTNITEYSLFKEVTNVNTIDFASNQISEINPRIFKIAQSTKNIDLTDNHLKDIKEDTFGKLNELRHLYLSHNLLETIDSKAFHGFPKLQILFLKNNKLRNIAQDAFLVNSTTYWLSLRNNSLTNISFVRNLYNLSKLDCTSNEIFQIKEDTFENTTKLKDFQCFNNQLQDLTFLKPLHKLAYLDLSNNSITNIPVTTFANLKDLEQIIMSNNQVEFIPTGTFAELNKLEKLMMDNNKLMKVGEIFDKLVNLQYFNVINNQLQQLPNEVTDNTINFTLYIDGNNWTCQFVKNLFNKSPHRIVYTPRNNITNYNNIPCVDEGFVVTKQLPKNGTDFTPPQSSDVFQSYLLPLSAAIAILLGVCIIIYFIVILIKRLQTTRNLHQSDIMMSILNPEGGYLEPRQIPREESIYEEIDSVSNDPIGIGQVQIQGRKNDYIL